MNYVFGNDKSTMIELEERYYRLKYFYLIDVDTLLNIIENDCRFKTIDETNVESFFHKVFECIFIASRPYNIFLDSNCTSCNQTFFGETWLNPKKNMTFTEQVTYTNAMGELIHIALRNHCIIYGILVSLHNNDSIEITAKNHGLFYNNMESNLSQKYTNHYRRKYIPENSDNYSHQILQHLQSKTTINQSTINQKPYVVPDYIKTFAFHIFSAPNFSNLNTEILKMKKANQRDINPNFITSYDNIYIGYITYLNQHSSRDAINKSILLKPLDQLLFCFPMEYFYGFSSIQYLAKLLQKIHTSKGDLNLLEGQLFTDTLKEISSLPNVYSRHFFLRYAIEALLSTDNPHFFLDKSPNVALQFGEKIDTKTFIRNEGFSRLYKFFRSLSTINIPILEDLWIVVLDRVLRKKITPQNNDPEKYSHRLISLYTTYINNNYELLTADFTRLTTEKISSLYKNKNFNYALKKHYKKQKKKDHTNQDLLNPFSDSTKYTLQQIMLHYFNIDNLQPVLPSFFVDDIMKYPTVSGDRIEDFIHDHRKVKFNYFW